MTCRQGIKVFGRNLHTDDLAHTPSPDGRVYVTYAAAYVDTAIA